MGKQQDRENIVQEIKAAADLYRKHLVGKRFLYVFEDRYIEVLYKVANFRHLTGVATNLSAKKFYSYAAKKMLQASQIFFTPQHPFSLCKRKIKHIGQIATLAGSEGFMLEEIVTDTRTYKFGTTDLNFTLCLNKEYGDNGQQKGDCFVVESLRDEDCFSKSRTAYTVTHIFSTPNDAKKYINLLFLDENATIDDLPDEIKNMLDQTLLHKKNGDHRSWSIEKYCRTFLERI